MGQIETGFLQRALTLRHLRLLIALDEQRQVHRVAKALHVSQPAVSKALAELEAGIGVRLFERTSKGLVPTAHGACLVRYAQVVANELARAGDELAGIERGIAAAVVVGVMPGGASGVLPAAILQSRQRLPGLVVTVNEGPMDLLLRQLRAGKLELVVGALAERSSPADIDQAALYNDPLVVVCGGAHPFARKQRPTWTELLAQPWVLPARAARLRETVESAFRRMGLAPPDVVAETVSLDMTLDLLGQMPALALLTQRLARRHAAGGLVRVFDVEVPGVVLPISMLTLRDAPASAAVATLKGCLIEAAARS